MIIEPDRGKLEQLQALTDAALAHLDLDQLLAELLDRIHSILAVDTCAILLLDEGSNELVARAAIGLEEEVEAGVRIPVGAGFAGRVVAERRPIVLADVDHANVLNPLLHTKGIKSLLGVPLLIEGEALGVLHVGSLTPRDFSQAEIDLLQLVADRASLAIEHARMYEAERATRLRLEHLQSVTDAALAHLELEELLHELLVRITVSLGVDTAAILLLDEERDELVARAAIGIEEEVEAGVRIPVGGGFAGRVAAERRPVFLPDVDHANVLNPILREKGIKSLLGVPLIVDSKVIGVLHIGKLVHTEFGAGATELLLLVAERAAIAIQRARLHDETVRLDQMKLTFVAIASHELRTPATTVYGMLATLVNRRDSLTPELRDQLEEVAFQEAERLRRLIEQLLDLSRLDARAIQLHRQHLPIEPLLDDILGAARRGDVELHVQPQLTMSVDPLVVDRVVSNLMVNAQRYGRPPYEVTAERSDHHLRICVKDHGAGVPPELVPRLFERFERGNEGGSGLGLAIARTYAQAHGGDVVYHADSDGARFELVLPIAP